MDDVVAGPPPAPPESRRAAGVLNRCDLAQARAEIERQPQWATAELRGWRDHCVGVAPIGYVAMLRFDAPRSERGLSLFMAADHQRLGVIDNMLDAGPGHDEVAGILSPLTP